MVIIRSRSPKSKRLLSVVQLPPALPRFVPVGEEGRQEFILLEDVIAARLPNLFGGFEIQHWTTFRITRDMDYDEEDEVEEAFTEARAWCEEKMSELTKGIGTEDPE